MKKRHVLLCWRSERGGDEVLENTVQKLEKKLSAELSEIILLLQKESESKWDNSFGQKVSLLSVNLKDPTKHHVIYEEIVKNVLPVIDNCTHLHINVSPGTPAMHTVWLILHAGGRFPKNTKLWSSQYNPETKRTSLREVEFPITTYLSEIRHQYSSDSKIAVYDVEAKSKSRMESLEQLKRFSALTNIPLLVLGERGTGKTRTIETIVKAIKQREVITMACGGLDSNVAESLLFGHKKGSFTGADSDREGLLRLANDKVLFLDEIQDLPQAVQRKLVRVLQDSRHRYRPVGADIEESSEFELICASNQPDLELQKSLDPDFYDRISMLKVTIPPLRECREDIQADWRNVWNELRSNNHFPEQAPESEFLYNALADDALTGNLRDLQKLAVLVLAYWDSAPEVALQSAIELWKVERHHGFESSLNNMTPNVTRDEHLLGFKKDLALWAKDRYNTWDNAALNLNCNEKTLRQDAKGK